MALNLPFRSLQARFTLLIVLAAALFAAIAAPLIYTIVHDRAIANDRVLLGDLVNAVETTAAVAAYTSDQLLLQDVVDGLGRNSLVSRVEIKTSAGTVASHGEPSGRGAPPAVVVERELTSPFAANQPVGSLRIEANRAELEASARHEALTLVAFMASMVVMISVILYATAQFYISRPIVKLANELHRMSPGTSMRLLVPASHADDEIGTLVSGANAVLNSNEIALQQERRLREEVTAMEAQYRKIFDSTSAGIFVLDRQGRLINANPTVLKIIGTPAGEFKKLQNEDFIRRVFARPNRARNMIEQSARSGQTVSADLELLQSDAAPAHWVHCLISVQGERERNADAEHTDTTEGVIYDITERRRQEDLVQHQAEHDTLTGLANRAATEAAIEHALNTAKAHDYKLTLLYVDLDGFKSVNDTRGHQAGDIVLQECARRMQATVRSSDLVGRIGGDEFIVMLNRCGVEDQVASEIAAKLLAVVSQPIELGAGQSVQLGCSIGIAGFPHHGDSSAGLIIAADAAMYAVKRNGKNAFAVAV
ncbi:sensor domain-containing diguanylate cyclase [Nevskia soli]|uniref:sensor domain-containing diguanylate cyclase n=1 Tax=Nevskia soli TaxID=418856 RepID=UPI0004A6B6D1|nr:sensor domain-containing diguanylate cyclase [Nevskia soli]